MHSRSRLLASLALALSSASNGISVHAADLAKGQKYLVECQLVQRETNLQRLRLIALDVTNPCREIALTRLAELTPAGVKFVEHTILVGIPPH